MAPAAGMSQAPCPFDRRAKKHHPGPRKVDEQLFLLNLGAVPATTGLLAPDDCRGLRKHHSMEGLQ